MKRTIGWTRALTALAALLATWPAGLGGGPVLGDVLVTRDGSRVETQGPWEVKGRLVVFHRLDGTLVSMRLSEVDPAASEEATAAAQAAAEKEAMEKAAAEPADEARGMAKAKAKPDEAGKQSAWVLTDADFTRRIVTEGEAENTESSETVDAASTDAAAAPVVLAYAREADPVDQHMIVTGTLANRTQTTATAISLEVSLYDEQTTLIQMRRAVIEQTVLEPGAETTFRAEFPDVYSFSAVQFRPRSSNLVTQEGVEARVPSAESAAAEEDDGGGTL